MFRELDENPCEFGSFEKPRRKYGSRISNQMEENVLGQIRENPSKSTRQIALELEIPQSAVMSVFKGDKLKCFRIRCAQKLHPNDPYRRLV
ncbi:hypothetical protein JTB14_019054 [Gonioctena quinquepunctata]|nr:hypothetical protein JTB14_019054 [Gonioctena quinquepunctata]